ncbi:MAG: FHA domain-containing protein [Archangiaceae bacterium]|nr:FHA domain-containing protein [Archangiaceae bacterium]
MLMQRPVVMPPSPVGPDWATDTAPLPSRNVKEDLEPVDLPDLLIGTLPPPGKDGTLELVVGRSPDCDVVLDDPAVSQKHAAILWDGKVGLLRELGSSNGTYLNGLRLGSRAALRTGDEVTFGYSTFVFLLSSELHVKLLREK